MTDTTHAELDRICTELCDKICRWPWTFSDQEEMDDKCAGCQILVDLANLVEELEAKIPPQPGEEIYVIANDCDNCPYPADVYDQCELCKKYAVAAETFTVSEHLDLWYNGDLYRTREAAEAAPAKREATP